MPAPSLQKGVQIPFAEIGPSDGEYIRATGKDAAFSVLLFNSGGPVIDSTRLAAKYWSDAGMAVKIVEVPDFNTLVGAMVTGQFDAAISGVGLAKDPDATAYPVLYSTSPTNFSKYKSSDMDAALDEGRTSSDPKVRKAAYARVQEVFRRDVPYLVLSPVTTHVLSTKNVCGIDQSGGFPSRTAGIGNCS